MLGEIYLEWLLRARSCVIHQLPCMSQEVASCPRKGDMGSSFQHPPLHLLLTVWPRVAGMLQGLAERVFVEVSPQRSEPRVSLSQQLAEDPGSSGMALG